MRVVGLFLLCAIVACRAMTSVRDNFDEPASLDGFDEDMWMPDVTGASRSTKCGALSGNYAVNFAGTTGERSLETWGFDARKVIAVEFWANPGGSCDKPESGEELILQYSPTEDSRDDWVDLQHLAISSSAKWTFYYVEAPTANLTDASRFRFYQAKSSGKTNDYWLIDDFRTVSSTDVLLTNLYEKFEPDATTGVTETNLDVIAGGTLEASVCDGVDPFEGDTSLQFTKSSSVSKFFDTLPMDLRTAEYVQFQAISCSDTSQTTGTITVSYSTDNWQSYENIATFYNEQMVGEWSRLTAALPADAKVEGVRLRFTVDGTSSALAIDNLYIGQCASACSSAGTCTGATSCKCDQGYSGATCNVAANPITDVYETFDSNSMDLDLWDPNLSIGGSQQTKCGVVNGKALSLTGSKLRQYVTRMIDTRHATLIDFWYMAGGGCDKAESGEELHVSYSFDGITFADLLEVPIVSAYMGKWKEFTIEIPAEAKAQSVRFKFAQAKWSSGTNDILNIDYFRVLQDRAKPTVLHEDFDAGESTITEFPVFASDSLDNAPSTTLCDGQVKPFDQSTGLLALGKQTLSSAYVVSFVETQDLNLSGLSSGTGFVQYHLRACDAPVYNDVLYVAYSIDNGANYEDINTKYLDQTETKWGRVTVPLPDAALRDGVRFRFYRTPSNQVDEIGLDSIYIGGCNGGCNNAGLCKGIASCSCDKGYGGSACSNPSSPITSKQDTFETLDYTFWDENLSFGVESSTKCADLSQPNALHMRAQNQRILTSRQIDARYVDAIELWFHNGGSSKPSRSCDKAEKNDEVHLEFSNDGGFTWTDLGNSGISTSWTHMYVDVSDNDEFRSSNTRVRINQVKFTGSSIAMDSIQVDNFQLHSSKAKVLTDLDLFFDDGSDVSTLLPVIAGGDLTPTPCGMTDASGSGQAIQFVESKNADRRFIDTLDIDASNAEALQLLLMSCGGDTPSGYFDVSYSTDHGENWQDIDTYWENSFYQEWTRFSINLGLIQDSLTSSTRFRFEPRSNLNQVAIDQITLVSNEACLGNGICDNNGQCSLEGCICDEGYEDSDCATPTATGGGSGGQVTCMTPYDIVLVLDGSASMYTKGWERVRTFCSALVEQLSIGTGSTDSQVGVYMFGKQGAGKWAFTMSGDPQTVSDGIAKMPFLKSGGTDIEDGITKATAELESSRHREGVSKVMLILTDGDQNQPGDPGTAAKTAMGKGIELYALGIGSSVSQPTLEEMASEPIDSHVFEVDSTSSLASVVDTIGAALCVECFGKIEMQLVMDGSGSISSSEFSNARKFAVGFASSFDLTVGSRIGAVQFGDAVRTEHFLTSNLTAIVGSLNRMPQIGGGTDITAGIKVARNEPGNPFAPRVMVVVTDGQGKGNPGTEADLARQQGILVFAVGVGSGVDKTELEKIGDGNVLTVTDYDDLTEKITILVRETCNAKDMSASLLSYRSDGLVLTSSEGSLDHDGSTDSSSSPAVPQWALYAVAGVALVALVGLAVFCVRRRRKVNSESVNDESFLSLEA